MGESVEKALRYLGESLAGRSTAAKAGATKSRPRSAKDGVAAVNAASGARSTRTRRAASAASAVADAALPATSIADAAVHAPQLHSTAVARLAARLAVSPELVLDVSDISLRTYHRRQEKQEPFTTAESDRVLRIARVASEAERVFGNPDKANRWLSSDNRLLGARPLALLATDAGARDVEHELIRIDHGDFA